MLTRFCLLTVLSAPLLAQAAAPAAPALKWRGSLWASANHQDRDTADGSLFLRPMEAGGPSLALDGCTLGADLDLGQGWSLRATLLGGHAAKVLNAASAESGSLALSEAQLVWVGGKDTVRLGRMNTFLGMEFLDGPANLTASRGLLFSFADPFGQVGANWHHAFSPVWSTDLFLFNGEDRVKDNNRGKTTGIALNYNHDGAADRYLSLHAYRGAEQDGFGAARNGGAEGRARTRMALMGQWVWGAATLAWEAGIAREALAPGMVADAPAGATARWDGGGFIFRYAFAGSWGAYLRAERFADDTGLRFAGDPSVAAGIAPRWGADLVATNLTAGLDRKVGTATLRFEARQDRLNRAVPDLDGKPFRQGFSLGCSIAASF